jgi:hypothetical protein
MHMKEDEITALCVRFRSRARRLDRLTGNAYDLVIEGEYEMSHVARLEVVMKEGACGTRGDGCADRPPARGDKGGTARSQRCEDLGALLTSARG